MNLCMMKFVHTVRDLENEIEHSEGRRKEELLSKLKEECKIIWLKCIKCTNDECVGFLEEDGYK